MPVSNWVSRDVWRERLVRWRARSSTVDLIALTVQGYRRHRLGHRAALLAHYGFLSVFPLLVCFTTIVGFVLQGDKSLQERIVDSALANLPVIGQQLEADPASLRGNGIILVVSLLTAAWAGLRAFVVAQTTIDDIDEVPESERAGLVRGRLRALAIVGILGAAQVVTALAASLVTASSFAVLAQVALVLLGALVNVVLVAVSFVLLTSREHPWRTVLPGAALAGVVFAGLQVVGALVVGRAIARATPVYGTFASVIGALSWLALHGTVALVAFQFNVVLGERRASRP